MALAFKVGVLVSAGEFILVVFDRLVSPAVAGDELSPAPAIVRLLEAQLMGVGDGVTRKDGRV